MNAATSIEEENHGRAGNTVGMTGAARPPGALATLVGTTNAVWPAILRVTLGGVMLPHGAQKVLGAFHGYGFAGTMNYFTGTIGLPVPLAAFVIFLEAVGAVALVLGIFTRAAAVGIGIVMLGAIFTVHAPNGFFMNWFGNQAGEGYEYHLLVLAMVAALVLGGGGRGSVDGLVWSSFSGKSRSFRVPRCDLVAPERANVVEARSQPGKQSARG